jgi:NAD(P)-dependent dehydrogenase (short-subunit alcohol dehydrogenase family)
MTDVGGFFRGRVVLVTGASSGIGAELARQLARHGASVAIAARRFDLLEELAVELRGTGATVLVLACDVAEPAAVAGALARLERELGVPDVAILNAGIGESRKIDEFTVEWVRRIFETNLFGVLHFVEPLLRAMLARKSGTIAVTSSLSRDRAMTQTGAYSASKAALSTVAESLRIDAWQRGVRILTIEPGFVKSPMTDRNRFPMPFMVSTERAGEIILSGVARGAPLIRFPWPMALITFVLRLLPARLFLWAGTHLSPKRDLKAPP